MKIFISPHNDDAVLFGSFTLLREKPVVLVVFDSYVQANRGTPVTMEQRRAEDMAALSVLGCKVVFLGLRDDTEADPRELVLALRALGPDEVWAPAYEVDGHAQHNIVADACHGIAPKVNRYLTYTRSGGKSRSPRPAPIEDASWIGKKLRALACYESQHSLDPRIGCWPHFMNDLHEYAA